MIRTNLHLISQFQYTDRLHKNAKTLLVPVSDNSKFKVLACWDVNWSKQLQHSLILWETDNINHLLSFCWSTHLFSKSFQQFVDIMFGSGKLWWGFFISWQ